MSRRERISAGMSSGAVGPGPVSQRSSVRARCRRFRVVPLVLGLLALASAAPGPLAAQDAADRQRAAQVASMLDLATTEYEDAVRDGQVVNEAEYAESREFTSQAALLFESLRASAGPGSDVAAAVAARLDSLASVVEAQGSAERYRDLASRVRDALAEAWGAVAVAAPDRRPSAASGARLYRQGCAACHGREGWGDGWAAEGMSPAPPDFTAAARHAEATAARDYQVILYGIPETAMPSHRDWLSVEETWDLVAYLQTLRHSAADVAEGRALALEGLSDEEGDDGSPVAGRLRAWSSPEEVARLTDADLAQRVRTTWAEASASAPGAEDSTAPVELSGEQVRAIVAYLRVLMGVPDRVLP